MCVCVCVCVCARGFSGRAHVQAVRTVQMTPPHPHTQTQTPRACKLPQRLVGHHKFRRLRPPLRAPPLPYPTPPPTHNTHLIHLLPQPLHHIWPVGQAMEGPRQHSSGGLVACGAEDSKGGVSIDWAYGAVQRGWSGDGVGHAGLMQVSWRSHAGLMQVSCRSHAGLVQVSCRSRAGLMQVSCRSHAGLMQEADEDWHPWPSGPAALPPSPIADRRSPPAHLPTPMPTPHLL